MVPHFKLAEHFFWQSIEMQQFYLWIGWSFSQQERKPSCLHVIRFANRIVYNSVLWVDRFLWWFPFSFSVLEPLISMNNRQRWDRNQANANFLPFYFFYRVTNSMAIKLDHSVLFGCNRICFALKYWKFVSFSTQCSETELLSRRLTWIGKMEQT